MFYMFRPVRMINLMYFTNELRAAAGRSRRRRTFSRQCFPRESQPRVTVPTGIDMPSYVCTLPVLGNVIIIALEYFSTLLY